MEYAISRAKATMTRFPVGLVEGSYKMSAFIEVFIYIEASRIEENAR